MTFTDSREKPLLDKTWQRVISFDESGPSKQDDVIDVDNDEEEGEWEYEDEEELITLDLGPDSKRLVQMSQQYSIAGLETETPFLQLGNLMFKGTWDKLIGTEIILKDETDVSRSQAEQHRLWPLPATETDRKIGRAPSTTRKRILFKQAVNMAAREAALVPPDDQISQPALWRQAPTLKESKTGLVTEKGWVWVRGRGWMRKEDTILLPQKDRSEINARPTSSEQDRIAEGIVQENEQEGGDDDDDDENERSNDENEQANETKTMERDNQVTASENQAEEPGNTSKRRTSHKQRHKLTPEEKSRYALLRSLRIVKKRREGQVDVDEGYDEPGDETNQTRAVDGEGEEEEEEDDEDEDE